MPQISRITDVGVGVCPCHSSPVTYVTMFAVGDPFVDADGLQVARIGDMGISSCGHPTIAVTGSTISTASGIPTHRIGDTGQNCGSYVSISGSPTTDSL